MSQIRVRVVAPLDWNLADFLLTPCRHLHGALGHDLLALSERDVVEVLVDLSDSMELATKENLAKDSRDND